MCRPHGTAKEHIMGGCWRHQSTEFCPARGEATVFHLVLLGNTMVPASYKLSLYILLHEGKVWKGLR